jgi:hypothetical protein
MDAQVPGMHDKEGTQMTPEGKIKARVRKALELTGAYILMPVPRGLGVVSLDFIVAIDGRFIAIETKVPGKKLTARQVYTANEIAKAGCIVFVIRDGDDIKTMLDALDDPHHGAGIYDTQGTGGAADPRRQDRVQRRAGYRRR